VAALWLVVTGGGAAVFRFLLEDRKTEKAECETRILRLESKLDESADLLRRQAESQQKQIDSQTALLTHQSQMIVALQELSKGRS
jgi:hypothetical protein